MEALKFSDSHNMVAYLEKSTENADFDEIVDFLNANPIRYALTISPTIYVSYIEQFWSTAKTKIVNNETQIHAKVNGKTIVITESSMRRGLQFNDEDEIFNDEYNTPSYTKKVFANMRRKGKDFLGIVTPLFPSMLGTQAVEGEGSGQPTEPQHTPTTASPSHVEPIPTVASSSHPKKTHKHRKTKRKATEISQSSGPTTLVADETVHEERGDSMERAATTAASLDAEQDSGNIIRTQSMATLNEPIPQGTSSGSGPRRQDTILGDRPAQTRFERLSKQSNDPPLSRANTLGSGEDKMKLNELMEICTKLSDRVLALENIKTAQDLEIINLKKRVKKLEKKKKARTPQLKRRLFKVKIESSTDKSLGDQEDASKQGRNEEDEDISWFQKDADTQGRYGHNFEVNNASAPVTTAGVSVSTAEPSTPPPTTTLIKDEDLIIAQTLMKIKKPSKSGIRKAVPPSQHDLKDKGKAKIIETEKPLKKKDQIKFDEEVAKRLAEELQAGLEEERVAKQRQEEANLISWDNTQAMMEADYELAQRLQAEEHGELTIEERSRLFVELMDKTKKHFSKLRAEKIRRKSQTKAQKRNQISTNLRNMAGYKHTQLKNKKVVEGSEKKTESSRKESVSKKRAGKELDEESVKRSVRLLLSFKLESVSGLCLSLSVVNVFLHALRT
ncbi:hypothetical protein Tco_0470846 [Tanacetum coccineum]